MVIGIAEKVATVQQRLQQLQAYTPAAQRFATQLLGCAASAADVCQSSLEKALTTSHFPSDAAVLKSWFFQVVRHQCLDHLRRTAQAKFNDAEPTDLDGEAGYANQTIHPDQQLQQQQMAIVMRRALAQLPLAHAEILWLREVHEFSYQQIATIIAVEAGTVMSRIHRARLALRVQLLKIIALEDL